MARRGYTVTMGMQVVPVNADDIAPKAVSPLAVSTIVSVIIIIVMLLYNAHKF